MFELADRLVGIYKTDNATKTVTINPRHFVVGGGAGGAAAGRGGGHAKQLELQAEAGDAMDVEQDQQQQQRQRRAAQQGSMAVPVA
jgi:structural maintenance of chromosome 4